MSFDPPANYATGTHPKSVAAGDLNNDNHVDLIAGGDVISLLLNNGDGTFVATPVTYNFLGGTSSVVAANIDDDNDLDIVACGANTVGLVINNSDGTFSYTPDTVASRYAVELYNPYPYGDNRGDIDLTGWQIDIGGNLHTVSGNPTIAKKTFLTLVSDGDGLTVTGNSSQTNPRLMIDVPTAGATITVKLIHH